MLIFVILLYCVYKFAKNVVLTIFWNKLNWKNWIERSPHIRKCFARLRLDTANTFNIDSDKMCDLCEVPINSTHLLTERIKTVTERELFFSKVKIVFPRFINMTLNIILNLAHTNDNVLNDICSYVKLICQKTLYCMNEHCMNANWPTVYCRWSINLSYLILSYLTNRAIQYC